jgi:hypothetical protein
MIPVEWVAVCAYLYEIECLQIQMQEACERAAYYMWTK